MAWVRVHDGALSHPKIVGLVRLTDPFTLWMWGLSYCQFHLTDGEIPTAALPKGTSRAIVRLVERGLWEATEIGFAVHDYLDWNDSRATVLQRRKAADAERTANRDRIKKWRDAKSGHGNGGGNGGSNALQNTLHDPLLKRPVKHRCNALTKPNQTKPNQETSTYPADAARPLGERVEAATTAARQHGLQLQATAEKIQHTLSDYRVTFAEFWAHWPKRIDKQEAETVWLKLKPSAVLTEIIIAAVEAQKQSVDWQKNRGQFIPSPAKWLRGHRWDDEVVSGPALSERTLRMAEAGREFLDS